MSRLGSIVGVLAVVLAGTPWLRAETGAEGWLRYAPVAHQTAGNNPIPNAVVSLDHSEVLKSATGELIRGVESMVGKQLNTEQNGSSQNAFVLGTLEDVRRHFHEIQPSARLSPDGFWLRTLQHGGKKYWLI